jgi:hypothetical protein
MTDPLIAAGLTSEGSITRDALLAGDFPRSSRVVTLTGGPYTRGTLMGNITATNKRTKCLNAAGDGSQVPESILAADADGSVADVQAIVYLSGEFNPAAMVIDPALTLVTIKESLRKIGIFLRGVVMN